jgi:hypothetical protein
VELRDREKLGRVQRVPVAQFVRKDGLDLGGRRRLNERVKDDNVLGLGMTSIRV